MLALIGPSLCWLFFLFFIFLEVTWTWLSMFSVTFMISCRWRDGAPFWTLQFSVFSNMFLKSSGWGETPTKLQQSSTSASPLSSYYSDTTFPSAALWLISFEILFISFSCSSLRILVFSYKCSFFVQVCFLWGGKQFRWNPRFKVLKHSRKLNSRALKWVNMQYSGYIVCNILFNFAGRSNRYIKKKALFGWHFPSVSLL